MTTSPEMSESDVKLGEMILHVSRQCESDPHFGAVKLNKILVFADWVSYLHHGKSISNSPHMRQPQGPVMRRMVPVRDELINSGRAAIQKVSLPMGLEQHRLIALDEPDFTKMSARDVSTMDTIIARFKDKNARECSDFSHLMPAWQIADNGEDIPLEAVFIYSLKPKPGDEILALELAEQERLMDASSH